MNAHLQFPCLLLSSSEGIITKALKIMSDPFRHIQFFFFLQSHCPSTSYRETIRLSAKQNYF